MTHISERELELPSGIIDQLMDIAAEHKEIISLGIGEPDFITPKPILDYAKKVIYKSSRYTAPTGKHELKEALLKKLKRENKISTNIDNIIVTTGSQEGLFAVMLATLDPTEQVILPNPCYLGYIPIIDLVEATPVYAKLEEQENFEINPEKIKEQIEPGKTKAILINTPSNPTGTVLSKKVLEEIADIARDNDLYIFTDEAYERLVYDAKHVSIASLNGMQDYVASFFTFSKSYAMCGFRIGYCVLPEKLIKPVTRTSHYMTLCPNNLSQHLAIKALSLPNSYISKMVNEYNKRRKYIVKRLNDINLVTRMPHGAFYAFSNITHVTRKKSSEFARDILKKCKVAVVPGSEFGKYGEGYLRFSYATKLDLIKKALDRIEKFLK